jgi:mRNA interferase YafQ
MLKPKIANQFKRDYALLTRRGYEVAKLDEVILLLLRQVPLNPRHRDHPLKGRWLGYRGCHIADDWVLVYKIDGEHLQLLLTRTGKHTDVFGR